MTPAPAAPLARPAPPGRPPRHALARRLSGGFALLLGLCVAGGHAPAHAEKALWELGLGAGALRLPHYRGSEQNHDWLLPVPYFVYRGRFFKSDEDGTRAVLLETERTDVDLSLGASPPTDSRNNRARAGMSDLVPTLEIGPNLNVRLTRGAGWQLDLRVPLRAVVGVRGGVQSLGYTFAPVLNLDVERHGWNFGLQGGPQAASSGFHAYYYGVDPADATATRPAYRAGSGYAGWALTASASRRAGDWWLAGFLQADSVAGAVFADSPLVTRRSHLSLGLAVSWIFKVSDARVADAR